MMVENEVITWDMVSEQLEIAREFFRAGRLDDARAVAENHYRIMANFLAAEEEPEPDLDEIIALRRICSELGDLKQWQELDVAERRAKLRKELYI